MERGPTKGGLWVPVIVIAAILVVVATILIIGRISGAVIATVLIIGCIGGAVIATILVVVVVATVPVVLVVVATFHTIVATKPIVLIGRSVSITGGEREVRLDLLGGPQDHGTLERRGRRRAGLRQGKRGRARCTS